jgi:hypothetical protein
MVCPVHLAFPKASLDELKRIIWQASARRHHATISPNFEHYGRIVRWQRKLSSAPVRVSRNDSASGHMSISQATGFRHRLHANRSEHAKTPSCDITDPNSIYVQRSQFDDRRRFSNGLSGQYSAATVSCRPSGESVSERRMAHFPSGAPIKGASPRARGIHGFGFSAAHARYRKRS